MGRMPELVVIGAMKCATSALHAQLDAHPEISMSGLKELNFFFGEDAAPPGIAPDEWWRTGQWHRGTDWYAEQLSATAPVRGESSPGYTDPAHPEVAARMAQVVPDVRLVYLVREPFERARSQWRHHRRDGLEPRPLEEAVLDESSQYLARSRFLERLEPFLARFDAEQVLVVVQERLRDDPATTLRRVAAHVGVDPARWPVDRLAPRHPVEPADEVPPWPAALRAAFRRRVDDDVERLRQLLGDPLPEWD